MRCRKRLGFTPLAEPAASDGNIFPPEVIGKMIKPLDALSQLGYQAKNDVSVEIRHEQPLSDSVSDIGKSQIQVIGDRNSTDLVDKLKQPLLVETV